MSGLLVMVPTRGRPEQCVRLLESFRETASPGTDILFILDPDDEDAYEGVGWGDAQCGTLAPRGTLEQKLNQTATSMTGLYDALFWTGDDHVFRTPGWDRLMLATLDGMGGDGWVYPDTVRRRDVPEIWMCSAALVDALGWFFPPMVSHYCGDNAVGELGKRSGLIRACPQATVEHLHYTACDETPRDQVYLDAEQEHGQKDLAAFQQWRASQLPMDVAALRRRFNPDVSWVLSKVA